MTDFWQQTPLKFNKIHEFSEAMKHLLNPVVNTVVGFIFKRRLTFFLASSHFEINKLNKMLSTTSM